MEISANDVLRTLHQMIDNKFGRTERGKYVNPHLLKTKMTLWSIAGEFANYEPELICKLLKELIERGSLISNMDEEKINPFDAYFIPKSELIDEEEYNIYAKVKRKVI